MTRPDRLPTEAALQHLLHAAPRRYRMPALPPTLADARAAGSEAVLAFAIEAARLDMLQGRAPDAALGDAFVEALASSIRRAAEGDPAFQAEVLRVRDPHVQAWVQLAAQAAGDERSVRSTVDAVAHPGKLRTLPEGPQRRSLEELHELAGAADWAELSSKSASLAASGFPDLRKLATSPALARLQESTALRSTDTVRQYLALRARSGPQVGSAAALDQGRASAREGDVAEQAAAASLGRVAALLDDGASPAHRVVRGLRTPRELAAAGGEGAKEEWDVAIVRRMGDGTDALVLLAEAKNAPAAATTDLPRLLRGLDQLSAADAQGVHAFRSAEGELRLRGDSLRALRPQVGALPAQVIYLCTAPAEARVVLLGASARARLLAEGASLQFAAALDGGGQPSPVGLVSVWEAVMREPRLRQVLAQYDTARRARDAMLHPDDLAAAADAILGRG